MISDSLVASGVISGGSWFGDRSHLLLVYAACILLPLCLIRRIQSFSFTSTFAVCSIVFMIAVVIRYSILEIAFGKHSQSKDDPDGGREIHYFNWGADLFKALPVVCFAFNCHLSFIPLFHELKPEIRSAKTMTRVAMGARHRPALAAQPPPRAAPLAARPRRTEPPAARAQARTPSASRRT